MIYTITRPFGEREIRGCLVCVTVADFADTHNARSDDGRTHDC